MSRETVPNQRLHLAFGGELADLNDFTFGHAAWRAKAQASVDNARMRYSVVHRLRLLEPDAAGASPPR